MKRFLLDLIGTVWCQDFSHHTYNVIVEAREDIAESVAVTMKSSMEQAFKGILPSVVMIVELVVRDSWG